MGDCLFTVERFGVGNEKKACEWLFRARPQARPNELLIFLVDELMGCQHRLLTTMNILVGSKNSESHSI